MSRTAYERLQAEYEDLTTRGRIEVADKIERARELGDLSENGDYHAAKDEQGHMEGRIRQLEHILENAEIVDDVIDLHDRLRGRHRRHGRALPDRPHRGARRRRSTSISPPRRSAAALIGHAAGDTVSYEAPNGDR